MDIFGIGPFEVLLILLVAFIIIGPQYVVEVSRKASKTIGGWARSVSDLNTKVQAEMRANISPGIADDDHSVHTNPEDLRQS